MKLRAKIYPKYLNQILNGDKSVEVRQIESMILVNSETGEEFEFEVRDVEKTTDLKLIQKVFPDVKWNPDLPTIMIDLGDIIKKEVTDNENK